MKLIMFLVGFFATLMVSSILNEDYKENSEYKIVYEKYIQKPLACEKKRETYHALIALKPTVSKSILQRSGEIKIKDSKSGRKIDLVLGNEGFYGYKNLFGKDVHYETWREHCSFGECQINLNFYSNEYDFLGEDAELSLEFYESNGERIYQKTFLIDKLPTIESIKKQPFVNVTLDTVDFKTYTMTYDSVLSAPFTAVYQFNDEMGNRYEIEKTFNKSQSTDTILNEGLVSYGAVYLYGSSENQGFETKVEIINNEDNFISICEQ